MDETDARIAELVALNRARKAARDLLWARVRRSIVAGVDPERIADALNLSRATLYRRLQDSQHLGTPNEPNV